MEEAVWDKSDYYEGCVKGRTVSIWDHVCCPWSGKMKYSALVYSTWRAGWMQRMQAFSLATQENYFLLRTQWHTPTYNWLRCRLFLSRFFLPSMPSTSNVKLLVTLYCGVRLKWENKKEFCGFNSGSGAGYCCVKQSLKLRIYEMVLASMFPCKILEYFNTRVGKKEHGVWVQLPDVWTCSKARCSHEYRKGSAVHFRDWKTRDVKFL